LAFIEPASGFPLGDSTLTVESFPWAAVTFSAVSTVTSSAPFSTLTAICALGTTGVDGADDGDSLVPGPPPLVGCWAESLVDWHPATESARTAAPAVAARSA